MTRSIADARPPLWVTGICNFRYQAEMWRHALSADFQSVNLCSIRDFFKHLCKIFAFKFFSIFRIRTFFWKSHFSDLSLPKKWSRVTYSIVAHNWIWRLLTRDHPPLSDANQRYVITQRFTVYHVAHPEHFTISRWNCLYNALRSSRHICSTAYLLAAVTLIP